MGRAGTPTFHFIKTTFSLPLWHTTRAILNSTKSTSILDINRWAGRVAWSLYIIQAHTSTQDPSTYRIDVDLVNIVPQSVEVAFRFLLSCLSCLRRRVYSREKRPQSVRDPVRHLAVEGLLNCLHNALSIGHFDKLTNPVDASRESCRQRANFDCIPSA